MFRGYGLGGSLTIRATFLGDPVIGHMQYLGVSIGVPRFWDSIDGLAASFLPGLGITVGPGRD